MKTLNNTIRNFDIVHGDFRQRAARGREKRRLEQNALLAQAFGMLNTLGTLVRKLQLQRSLNRAEAQERKLPNHAPTFPDTDEGRRARAEFVGAQIAADARAEYNKEVEQWRRLPTMFD